MSSLDQLKSSLILPFRAERINDGFEYEAEVKVRIGEGPVLAVNAPSGSIVLEKIPPVLTRYPLSNGT